MANRVKTPPAAQDGPRITRRTSKRIPKEIPSRAINDPRRNNRRRGARERLVIRSSWRLSSFRKEYLETPPVLGAWDTGISTGFLA